MQNYCLLNGYFSCLFSVLQPHHYQETFQLTLTKEHLFVMELATDMCQDPYITFGYHQPTGEIEWSK